MARAMRHSGIPWIGEIPETWKVKPHKRVMHKEKEIKEQYEGESILSLTMRGVIVRDLDAGGKMPTSFDGYQLVYPNELLQCLFDIDVTPRCVGVVKQKGLVSPAYSRFVMHEEANAYYYDYLLRFMDDNKVLLHLSKNLRSSLTETDFGAINTCVPPLQEQQVIADFLDKKCAEIDQLVALQEKFIEELKAYKQSIITETVTKGLNPNAKMKDSGVEWIGEVPEGWKDISLRQLFVIKAGGDAKPELYSDVCDVEHPYPVYTNTLDAKQVYAYTSMPLYCANSITVTGRGAVGHAIYREEPYDAIIRLLSLSPKMDVDCRYYAYYIDNVLHIFTNNAAIAQLSAEQLAPYHVLLPSKSEQQAIADYLDKKCAEIDQLITLKQNKIEEYKEYKKSLVYEYVTGKKEVSI